MSRHPRRFRAAGQVIKAAGRAFDLPPIYDLIEIIGNTLDGTAGIFIQAKPGAVIIVENNVATNIKPGPKDTGPVQFLQVSGLQGSDLPAKPCVIKLTVQGNKVTNTDGQSEVEDVINIIAVSGTAQSPLLVADNTIVGAFAHIPELAAEYSGSGIMLDRGTCWALVHGNNVSRTSNVGIGIAGGQHNRVIGNAVYESGGSGTGDVGIYRWGGSYPDDPFGPNAVLGNDVNWIDKHGNRNDYWLP